MQASPTAPATASGTRPHNRRKKLFINPGFQWRYAALIAGGVFIVALLMCTVMYGVLYEQARARILYLAPRHALENTVSLVLFAGIFALVMSATFALWGVIVSHRICGPVHVMSQSFDEIVAGRFPTMRDLRRKDEFKEFYEQMRRAVNQLREDKRAELASITDALELVDSVEDSNEAVRAQALAALRAQLELLHQQALSSLGGPVNSSRRQSGMTESAGAKSKPAAVGVGA